MISILSVFPPYRGGIANFSDYLYQNLQKQVDVTAFNYSYLYPPFLFPGKSQYISDADGNDYAYRILHSYNPFNWANAANEILTSEPEVLIVCYWHPFFAPALLKVISQVKRKNPELPVYLLAHNVVPHETFPFGATLSKKLLTKADKLILLSQKSIDEAHKLNVSTDIIPLFHPVYEQRLPSLTQNELRTKHGFSNKDKIFLFFGLIRPYKGLDLLIEALNDLDLEKHRIRPLIVGEFYTDKSSLLSRIKTSHKHLYTIEDRFVSDEEMAEYFTLSDALVMPYRSASQSGILANAINFHLPTIVTNLKGLTEHVEHQNTAFIIQKEQVKELREAMLTFTNKDTLNSIKKALIPLKKQLSWKTFTDRLLEEISKENS